MQKLIQMKNKKGFTLIEMLIVILIIVILLAIAVPAVSAYRKEALRTQDEGAIETIRTSIESTLIRVRPADNNTDSNLDEFSASDLDYAELVARSQDTTIDVDTREFYGLLAEYLGPNFQGNFNFQYNFGSSYSSGSTAEYLYYLTYWRSDEVSASKDAVMLYHNNFGNTNTALRQPAYISEALGKLLAHDPSDTHFTQTTVDNYMP